jgi:hypothetical protein
MHVLQSARGTILSTLLEQQSQFDRPDENKLRLVLKSYSYSTTAMPALETASSLHNVPAA